MSRWMPREQWGWREYRILLLIPAGIFCLIMAIIS